MANLVKMASLSRPLVQLRRLVAPRARSLQTRSAAGQQVSVEQQGQQNGQQAVQRHSQGQTAPARRSRRPSLTQRFGPETTELAPMIAPFLPSRMPSLLRCAHSTALPLVEVMSQACNRARGLGSATPALLWLDCASLASARRCAPERSILAACLIGTPNFYSFVRAGPWTTSSTPLRASLTSPALSWRATGALPWRAPLVVGMSIDLILTS